MPAPQKILTLVEHFKRKREELKAVRYKEAQLRVEFLDPLLEALGWDMRNTQGHSEAMKEVIHEDAIRIGDALKAPDYCMKIGRDRKFFVEAKKPSVDIKGEPTPALQLRRYAWSAKLPLSILSDFEEFAIYDCRIRPHKADKASTARIFFCTFEEYAKRWDEIVAIFSKEAVLKGSFDKYAGEKRRGVQEVDDEFLKEIEHWRELLAKNIATRNTSLGQQEMNYAVQQTIDRIIFLRICEDRGIETYGRLQGELNGSDIYGRLKELFREADARYNSGLFHFKEEKSQGEPPDTVTPHIDIDDSVLKEIISCLYPPESPYAFSVISSEILGQVYEQFLGKVIRLTEGHHAKVEEKPEVRKAGGVYYTPKYIVDYIVEHSVGKLLEGKTPKQVAELKIVDPACGSGSFLLGAYQLLLDWHLTYYTEHEPKKWKKELYSLQLPFSEGGPQWRLTTTERKRILLHNIFGVDIDPQAVEVTKLSLLLKVLEGETAQSMQTQMFHERVLPDLGKNIQCGNSLIGPDFYDGEQQTLLDAEDADRQRINVFDWESAFSEVFKRKNPGFDAVIGNPPYLFITEVPNNMREYYQTHYSGVSYRFDLYGAFIEKTARLLLSQQGCFGFIIPHTLLSNDSFRLLRAHLANNVRLYQIVDFGPGVFENAKNETMILFFNGKKPSKQSKTIVMKTTPKIFPKFEDQFVASQLDWASADGNPWLIHVGGGNMDLLKKMMRNTVPLEVFCTANQGLRTGDNEEFIAESSKGKTWEPAAGGKHIARYKPIYHQIFVRYEPELLDAPRKREIFETSEKIVVQEIRNISLARRIIATLDDQQTYCLQSTNVINLKPDVPLSLRYLLGILNSTAINFYFRCRFPGNNHIPSNQLLSLPIRNLDLSNPTEKNHHDQIVTLVEQMISLHRKLSEAKTPHDQTSINHQIETIDRKIDELVYELYGLTKDEISIVERDI